MTQDHAFPGGARFAFTIIDDTDVATVDNVRPIYRLLEALGMRTTKTVWPVRCEEGSRNFFLSETMDFYQGHCPGSPYWWGDLCLEQIEYVRNLTFSEINLLRVNPSMPYRDPGRPYVRWWFSATDAEDADAFNGLLQRANQERLEAEGGVCIVATHFGKGFASSDKVNPETQRLLESLAARKGWFPPVGDLLDWLRARRDTDRLPAREWRRMQWRWARDLLVRRLGLRWRASA